MNDVGERLHTLVPVKRTLAGCANKRCECHYASDVMMVNRESDAHVVCFACGCRWDWMPTPLEKKR